MRPPRARSARRLLAPDRTIDLLVDLDVGMHRTGIAPELAPPLYRLLATLPGVTPGGLHAYDGHLRDPDLAVRRAQADAAFAPGARVATTRCRPKASPVPRVVVGGTPTLPCHATRDEPDLELSPGTVVFWDAGYTAGLPDMDFLPAALVLTRVVSKPGGNRVTPRPRTQGRRLGDAASAGGVAQPQASGVGPGLQAPGCRRPSSDTARSTSCFETPDAASLHVGDVLYGMPWHVCPTVALHGQAVVVRDGRAVDRWHVTARERMITV